MAYDLGLAERVRSILERRGSVDERKMFGGVCFMVNGHMCCGVLKTDLILKLSPEEGTQALASPHARPFDFSGKPMKSMVYINPRGTDSDEDLHRWVETARSFAQSQPPKEAAPKPAKRPASKSKLSKK